MKKRFSEEQIVRILREAESGTGTIRDLAKANNITEQTFDKWRQRYGGADKILPNVQFKTNFGFGMKIWGRSFLQEESSRLELKTL